MCLFFVGASILSGMYGHIASALWAKGFSDHQVGLLTSVYQFGTTVVQLLFGMVSGVYSTMCIATQLWVSYKTRKAAPAPKKA